ncbi:MAG: hypothetical protein PHS93_07905 [Candidatus Omnitrophica bacterium]|nr:hypothetical protein [Candidatus Omnitrophota bacterium]
MESFGCKNYHQKYNAYFWAKQTNNVTEQMYRLLIEQIKKKYPAAGINYGYLETCGDSSAVNCIIAIDNDPIITCPGGYLPQSDCMLAMYHNDPNNFPRFKKLGYSPYNIQNNRVFATYPDAVKMVFGKHCELFYYQKWQDIIDFVKYGKSVQLCLKNPGHYIAVIGATKDKELKLDCIDSWPERTGSHLFQLTEKEYNENTFETCAVYYEK